MAARFLRIEGVNHSATVYDSQDLGATQGASLALLEAPLRVAQAFGLTPEFMGASQGLFRVPAEQAHTLADSVRAYLRGNDPLRHLCFVVDVADDQEIVTALNRRSQMQSLSVVLPEPGTMGCCAVDRIRPAAAFDGDDVKVSASVKARRDYRRERRQDFYLSEIGVGEAHLPSDDQYAHSFHDIVRDPPGTVPESLHNKIAVLYFDGNRFGAIRDLVGVTKFAAELKGLRRALMEKMTPVMGGLERAETILWGGDEMMWVVPAWQMWSCLSTFFAATQDWPHGMSHAGGVVVCHHKTPIRLAKALAEELAEKAKGDRSRSAIQIEILESIDIPETYLDRQRIRLFGPDAPESAFSLSPEGWLDLTRRMGKVKPVFPRSQLYRLLKMARDDGARISHRPDKVAAVLAALQDILDARATGCTVEDLVGMAGEGGKGDPRLLRLAQLASLWDYYLPEGGQ